MQHKGKIPFLDLIKQYHSIQTEIDQAVQNVLNEASFIKGRQVREFEEQFADYCGIGYCIGMGNGTDALVIALRALNIGRGDEVITVANTFIATVEAIATVGATPVLIDIDYETYTMNPESINDAITEKTAAIIPVHLYGMPCDIDKIMAIAKEKNLPVIFDAAQAHGAKYKGKAASIYGTITTFSFYPGKNLGAYGDGGALVTDNQELASKIRMLADHGRTEKYLHQYYGYNSRLDSLQAAILSVKLKYLEHWNNRRKEITTLYEKGLKHNKQVFTPSIPDYADPVWHLYVIQAEKRDELKEYLKNQGIATGIHYPVSIPFQPAAHDAIVKCDKTKLQSMCDHILSLPMCPEMTDKMVLYVVDCINNYYS